MRTMTVPDALRLAMREIQSGDARRAEAICRQVLGLSPGSAGAMHLLGLALGRMGRREEALPWLRRSVEASAASAEFRHNLGSLLGEMGRPREAAEAFAAAIALRPGHAESHANLSTALHRLNEPNKAAREAWRAAALDRASAARWRTLGAACKAAGRPRAAVLACRRAAALEPLNGDIHNSLATSYMDEGDAARGIAHYRRAVELRPEVAAYHSNLLYALHHSPDYGMKELFAEHTWWAARHATGLTMKPADTEPLAGRRLRVGFIAADFRQHATACFLEPAIRGLDREAFEVFCFSDVRKPDEITARFKAMEVSWHDIAAMNDEAVADLIRSRRVDILIDPTGHMSGNRLLVFARKPAPIQIAYSSYPGTTGLTAIDYFLTDSIENPPGCDEALYSERLLRMPRCARCYQPPTDAPQPGEPPASRNGYPTFGAFNRPSKVTPQAIAVWAKILQAIPEARLLVLTGCSRDGRPMRAMHRAFAGAGVSARIQYLGRRSRRDYFKLFQQVDIALDAFPYAGCTTTCDALWMGVPVVAMAGLTMASRAGATLLHRAGLVGCVAEDAEAYCQKAAQLAWDTERLRSLRGGLRPAMSDGVANAERFGHDLGRVVGQAIRETAQNKYK